MKPITARGGQQELEKQGLPPAPAPSGPTMEDELRKIEADLPPAPPPPPAAPGPDTTAPLIEAIVAGDHETIETEAGKATPEDLQDVIELVFWGVGEARGFWVGRKRQLTPAQRARLVKCWDLHPETSARLGRYLIRMLERHGVEVTAGVLADVVTVGLFVSAGVHHWEADAEYLASLPTPTQADA